MNAPTWSSTINNIYCLCIHPDEAHMGLRSGGTETELGTNNGTTPVHHSTNVSETWIQWGREKRARHGFSARWLEWGGVEPWRADTELTQRNCHSMSARLQVWKGEASERERLTAELWEGGIGR